MSGLDRKVIINAQPGVNTTQITQKIKRDLSVQHLDPSKVKVTQKGTRFEVDIDKAADTRMSGQLRQAAVNTIAGYDSNAKVLFDKTTYSVNQPAVSAPANQQATAINKQPVQPANPINTPVNVPRVQEMPSTGGIPESRPENLGLPTVRHSSGAAILGAPAQTQGEVEQKSGAALLDKIAHEIDAGNGQFSVPQEAPEATNNGIDLTSQINDGV